MVSVAGWVSQEAAPEDRDSFAERLLGNACWLSIMGRSRGIKAGKRKEEKPQPTSQGGMSWNGPSESLHLGQGGSEPASYISASIIRYSIIALTGRGLASGREVNLDNIVFFT